MKNDEDFAAWLAFMDQAMFDFQYGIASAGLSKQLDFSLESLRELEKWLHETFNAGEDVPDKKLDRISRYVGEVICRNGVGMRWSVNFADQKLAYCGLPTVTNGVLVDCPARLVTASFSREGGGFIERISRNLVRISQEQSRAKNA